MSEVNNIDTESEIISLWLLASYLELRMILRVCDNICLFNERAMMNSNKYAHTFDALYVGMAAQIACSRNNPMSMSGVNNNDFKIQIISLCLLSVDLDTGMVFRMLKGFWHYHVCLNVENVSCFGIRDSGKILAVYSDAILCLATIPS
ncbi:hypothetical protein Tco_0822938 [Tanacetum coccineum]|uniref:Uncharacterized protein n=1 Tax=Tanacetum coccineum TaxID=301880 RepID=A0ABQ5AL21_9ASTR